MVREKDRSKSRFELSDKALNLAVYTSDILANEKIFDRKYQTVIDRIAAEATMIYHCIRVANDIKVLSKENTRKAEERTRLQREALSNIEPLKTDILIAHKLFHLKAKRIRHWNNQVDEIGEMLKGWISSDMKKYKELGM